MYHKVHCAEGLQMIYFLQEFDTFRNKNFIPIEVHLILFSSKTFTAKLLLQWEIDCPKECVKELLLMIQCRYE